MWYKVEEAAPGGLASDPFSGDGVFLALPGAGGLAILVALAEAFGPVLPAVAQPRHGAWVNVRRASGSRDELIARWEALHPASRQDSPVVR